MNSTTNPDILYSIVVLQLDRCIDGTVFTVCQISVHETRGKVSPSLTRKLFIIQNTYTSH
jgi:hypothetical protein